MWIKRSPGHCRLEKAIRQQELREQRQEEIYQKRQEKALERVNQEYKDEQTKRLRRSKGT